MSNYQHISTKYSHIPNLKFILTVIQDEFTYIFNLEAINAFYATGQKSTNIVRLFECCLRELTPSIVAPDKYYASEEIVSELAKYL